MVESQQNEGGCWPRRGEVQTPKGQVAGQERSHCISGRSEMQGVSERVKKSSLQGNEKEKKVREGRKRKKKRSHWQTDKRRSDESNCRDVKPGGNGGCLRD